MKDINTSAYAELLMNLWCLDINLVIILTGIGPQVVDT